MIRWVALLSLVLGGCGRYGEFRLPAAEGDAAADLRWRWEPEPAPVINRGQAGAFDSVDALNPAIARTPDGGYLNLYSGWDGKAWRTAIAVSTDGRSWEKKGVALEPGPAAWEGSYIAANGALSYVNGVWMYWYQAGIPPRIGLARSTDGVRWEKAPEPVMETGPRGAWDERGVADPYVVRAGGRFYMYFLGQDRARRQRLGVAVSDDGVQWTKQVTNPVMELGAAGEFDENGLGEPAVWEQFGRWWMLYTGRDRKEWRRTGLAVSKDGVKWERRAEGAVLGVGEGWNSRVVCDPEVERLEDGRVRVWFGGGDRPEPAENLHGQIGVGVLRPELRNR
jgi:predicted GH43/DUF377 family glycosyl hydrolase